jgi:hypothetical protein
MKTLARLALAFSLALAAPIAGCDSAETAPKTGDEQDVTQKSAYTADMSVYNKIYNTSFETLDQAYTVMIKAGDKTIPAPTHLFGEDVNVIAYSNDDGDKSADGEVFERGDQEIAKVFKKGQIGIGLKHHRSEFPSLDLNESDASEMKEHFKLQDTHIEIVVGVERDGKPGAITLNNPQNYEEGAFGDEKYAMAFLRPVFPSYLSKAKVTAYEANILTMVVGFNAVTNFPGDYNGGDPLGARSVERVREHVKNMVLALTGDEAARAYFKDPANQVYCAELAHLSFTAGMHVPLNDKTMKPLVGDAAWKTFKDYVKQHNEGKATPFTTMNENPRVGLIRELKVATATLKSIGEEAPANRDKLAFEPMTMSDIVEQFIRTHMPREILGEELAPLQGAVLEKMRPGLLEVMKLDQAPADHPARIAVEGLYTKIVEAASKPYANYAAFRTAIEPLLAQARTVTGPRQDDGIGLFVPPSLFHVIAQGKHQGGLLGMQYEGHGVHVTAVKKLPGSTPAPTPTPVDDIASEASCKDSCGKQARGGCWCDATCDQYGDCCDDKAAVCE